jgi:hypothetical protein
MYDLNNFTIRSLTECGAALRQLGQGVGSMEGVAQKIAEYLYEHLRSSSDKGRACVLVRLYLTLPYSDLDQVGPLHRTCCTNRRPLIPNT